MNEPNKTIIDWDYAETLTWGNLKAYIDKQFKRPWAEFYRLCRVIKSMNERIKYLRTVIEEQREVTQQLKLINKIISLSEKDSARVS